MGLRFRRSVRICKGVRINFSSSGISYTFGFRGATITKGKKGTHLNIGVPGTGISYRTKISEPKNNRNNAPIKSSQQITTEFSVAVDEYGNIVFLKGEEIVTDSEIIKKIKNSPQYKNSKYYFEGQRDDYINQKLTKKFDEHQKFLNVHKQLTRVHSLLDFEHKLNTLVKNEYKRETFVEPKPTIEKSRQILSALAQEKVSSWKFWQLEKMRREWVEERLQEHFNNLLNSWDERKRKFEENQESIANKLNLEFEEEYFIQKEVLKKAIEGEKEFIFELIDSWISTLTLPIEININYDFVDNKIILDLDLPEIEDLPNTELVKLANGTIKEKKLSKERMQLDYASLVYSLNVFLAAAIFDLSPAIHNIIMSGYTQRRNKIGDIQNDYITSFVFCRKNFENRPIASIKPEEFCLSCQNRLSQTSTGLFKVIKPFTLDDALINTEIKELHKEPIVIKMRKMYIQLGLSKLELPFGFYHNSRDFHEERDAKLTKLSIAACNERGNDKEIQIMKLKEFMDYAELYCEEALEKGNLYFKQFYELNGDIIKLRYSELQELLK